MSYKKASRQDARADSMHRNMCAENRAEKRLDRLGHCMKLHDKKNRQHAWKSVCRGPASFRWK